MLNIYYDKNTWDLPKRITRSMAEELSATPQYKKEIWELHKKKQENLCKKLQQAKVTKTRKEIKSPTDTVKRNEEIQESKQAQDPDPRQDLGQDPGQGPDLEQNPGQNQDPCISTEKNKED